MSKVYAVTLTDDEAARFEQAAARLGYSVEEYLRRCAVGVPAHFGTSANGTVTYWAPWPTSTGRPPTAQVVYRQPA